MDKQDILNILRMKYGAVKHLFNNLYICDLKQAVNHTVAVLVDLETFKEIPISYYSQIYITHELKIIKLDINDWAVTRINLLVNTTTNESWKTDSYTNNKIIYIAEDKNYLYIVSRNYYYDLEDDVIIDKIDKQTAVGYRMDCTLEDICNNKIICSDTVINVDNIIYDNFKDNIDKDYILSEVAKLELDQRNYTLILGNLYDYSSRHVVDDWYTLIDNDKEYLINVKTLQKIELEWINMKILSTDLNLVELMSKQHGLKRVFVDAEYGTSIGNTWVTDVYEDQDKDKNNCTQDFEMLIENSDSIIWVIRHFGKYDISIMNKETHITTRYKRAVLYHVINRGTKLKVYRLRDNTIEFDIINIWGINAH